MASGSEDVISLELAEHVAVDIRRADAFSRTKREAAAGTETNSADDAVGIRNLSLFGRGKCVGQAACLLARIEIAETV